MVPQSDMIDMASFASIGWESLLLSLAIADRFRAIRRQHDAGAAERAALARVAATDALTGLANRNAFQARLDQRSVGRDGADLILFDVDFLKQVNDQGGHDAGDALIAAVAVRLRSAAGENALIARIGGDEFVVLLEGAERIRCETLLALVTNAAAQPVDYDGQLLRVSISAGHAALTSDQSLREGYKQADLALYRAKASGRGCWRRFTTDMADADEARTRFLAEAQAGLDDNSFRLNFQPIVLIDGRRPLAMRAQLQWQHPRLGRLGLDDARDAFADPRLASRYQAWQLDQALRWLARLRTTGQPMPAVAVEVLPQALSSGLVGQVTEALEQHGLPANALWLLVSTDALTPASGPVLSALHNAGVQLVLSGFGVGQTSMTALRDVPAGWILLDSALSVGLADDAEQQQWVSAVVALAHRMGRKVIAPGVARDVEARALRGLAVDAGTGPLFADAGPRLVAVAADDQGRAG
jgi:diguanylate cyclase (GGDEF)-like protein